MLREKLAGIRNLGDLTSLFTLLGYSPDGTPYMEDGVVVAHWKGFRVIAAAGPDHTTVTRRLAQHMAQSTTCGLAVGIGRSDQISIAAPKLGAAGISRVLNVSLANPSADALELIGRLRPVRDATGLQHALRVDELLAGEAVSERFYAQFRRVHSRMADSVDVPVDRDRNMLALLALIRVLFLYFVQAKGWLDQQTDYLRCHYERTAGDGSHFHGRFLNILFFKTLNTPIRSRKDGAPGQIPYLNGGLFEPHAIELRWPRITFTNSQWQLAFEELFDRFRFCIIEAKEADAIAPDMLGRVFERVMETDLRHTTGTYYTPESIVRLIVKSAIQSSISTLANLSEDDAERVVTGEWVASDIAQRAAAALSSIRLLDPAVGSGAFLLGALDTLTRAWAALDEHHDIGLVQIRKKILQANLFGVDLNPIAVKLAELRLWLAVIADDPTVDIRSVEPLPNLDGVVQQGDSLIDPVATARSAVRLPVGLDSSTSRQVARARNAIFNARRNNRTRALAQLRRAELAAAERALQESIDSTTAAMRDLAAAARGRDLFGKRVNLSREKKGLYDALKQNRSASRKALAAVREGSVPFFSYEVHTPEIMKRGGFTTVVGNPPWVRAERLPPSMRRELKHRFSWWKATGERGFNHLPDASIAFTQRALELTRPGGTLAFLVPAKITSAAYSEHARQQLAATTTLEYLHRLPSRDADQFGATTYPMALVVRKEKATPSQRVKLDFAGKETVPQHRLCKPGPWILASATVRDAVHTLLDAGRPLGTVAPAILGLKTGANSIFLGHLEARSPADTTLRIGGEGVTLPNHEVRPVLRGRDVRRFGVRPVKWMVWTHDPTGAPLQRVSRAATRYFTPHRRRLETRADFRGGPIWTVFRLSGAIGRNRVVWSDIVRRPQAAALVNGSRNVVPLNTCYVSVTSSTEDSMLIAAVMNSTWIATTVKLFADEARGGYRRMNARVANLIPIPEPSRHSSTLCEMSWAAHEGENIDQGALDAAVAESLGLPAAARRAFEAFDDHHGV